MRIVLRDEGSERDVTVDPESTTSAQLAALAGLDADQPLFLDSKFLPGGATLASAGGLEGSVVTVSAEDPHTEPFHVDGVAVIELHQIAGIGAGGFLQLPAGRYYLGPSGPRVGALVAGVVDNARFRLAVTEGGTCRLSPAGGAKVSIDGKALEGTVDLTDQYVEVDGVVFRVTPAMDRRRPAAEPGAGGRLRFIRPARQHPGAASRQPLPIPTKWAKARRRDREQVDEAERYVTIGWQHALDEARSAHPDIAELRARARVVAPTLWERRQGHHDHLSVAVGFGTGRWRPTPPAGDLSPELAELLHRTRDLPVVPITVPLGQAPVEIVGPRHAVAALTRWLLIQAVVHQGPDDLSVEVQTTEEHAAEWSWVGWLPHAGETTPRHPAKRPLVLYVDDTAGGDGAKPPGARILLATSPPPLAPRRDLIIHVSGDGVVALFDSEARGREEGVVTGITLDVAGAVARDLAGLSPMDVADLDRPSRSRR
jgi:hypothetical protein